MDMDMQNKPNTLYTGHRARDLPTDSKDDMKSQSQSEKLIQKFTE